MAYILLYFDRIEMTFSLKGKMIVSRYLIAAILLLIYGCGSSGGSSTSSSSSPSSSPPNTSLPIFSNHTTPSGTNNDEGQFNSMLHTQALGVVGVYYSSDNASIKMVSSTDSDGIFTSPSYYFTDTDVEDDNVTLLADSNGYHILYLHITDGLQYVFNNDLGLDDGSATEWIPVTVDAGISVKAYSSMAIDSSGYVHVSYYDITNAAFKYATNATGSWVTETVDSGSALTVNEVLYDTPNGAITVFRGQSADNTSLLEGKITVTFTIGSVAYSEVDNRLGAFYNTNAKITSSTINYTTGAIAITFTTAPDNTTDIALAIAHDKYSSIVIDGSDLPHISYYDYHTSITNGNLKFASRDADGNWTLNTLDSTGNVGLYSYLTLHNSFFYITYYDSHLDIIKLISNETRAWISTTLVSEVPSATSCPLVITDSGTKHISYFKNCDGNSSIDLCYAIVGVRFDTPVDTSGIGNGEHISLALDSVSGKPYFLYYDAQDNDLKFSRQISP